MLPVATNSEPPAYGLAAVLDPVDGTAAFLHADANLSPQSRLQFDPTIASSQLPLVEQQFPIEEESQPRRRRYEVMLFAKA